MKGATVAKERTICLTAEEVRLSLEGGKDILRRPLNPQPVVKYPGQEWCLVWKNDEHFFRHTFAEWANEHGPLGKVGDRLLVREPAEHVESCGWNVEGACHVLRYSAGGVKRFDRPNVGVYGFMLPPRSAAVMPRWACRYAIEITESKVEQLQDISQEDAKAEGVNPMPYPEFKKLMAGGYVRAFKHAWDSARGKRYPWASNPWVQAIRYKLVELSKE